MSITTVVEPRLGPDPFTQLRQLLPAGTTVYVGDSTRCGVGLYLTNAGGSVTRLGHLVAAVGGYDTDGLFGLVQFYGDPAFLVGDVAAILHGDHTALAMQPLPASVELPVSVG